MPDKLNPDVDWEALPELIRTFDEHYQSSVPLESMGIGEGPLHPNKKNDDADEAADLPTTTP